MWYFIIAIALFLAGYIVAKKSIQLEQKTIDDEYFLDKYKIENEITQLKKQQEIESKHLQDMHNQAEEAGRAHYEKTMELVNNNIARDIDALEAEYQQHKDEYKQEFLDILKEMANNFTQVSFDYQKVLDELKLQHDQKVQELNDISDKISAAVESNKRALLDETDNQFYRCTISDLFQKEIKHLRSIEPYLMDTRPLCKIIWESYYRNSCSALLDRLTKGEKISGIYKMTNLYTYIKYHLSDKDKQYLLELDKEFGEVMNMFRNDRNYNDIVNIEEEYSKFIDARRNGEKYIPMFKMHPNKFSENHILERMLALKSKFVRFNCFLSKYYIQNLDYFLNKVEFTLKKNENLPDITFFDN